MTIKLVQDILNLVEKPSRYLGTEINTKTKDLQQVPLHMCLAFPDLYEIGTSHFGMQILYHILNEHPMIYAERAYAPATDMEYHLRRTGIPFFSLESKTPLKNMDIIGFSLLYELSYTNILNMLDLSGIPFFASERDETYPLIIAGGPCTCNPEPIADFFDAIVIGDGESIIIKMSEAWISWKQSGKKDKDELLKTWSDLEGVYIPSFYEIGYDANGFQTISSLFIGKECSIKRIIERDLEILPFPDKPIVPYGRPIHDRLRLEVARGCTRGCRFCQAGMIYRPVRERSVEKLLSIASTSIPQTGYEDISLLSLSTGDYGCLSCLMQTLMEKYAREHIAISLPSVRAGTLTPELMHLIKKVRKTGFTIAPEAGTQRLRDVINKDITEEEITATVSQAFEMGWQIIKLYFMTGLPTETEEDLRGIIDLINVLRKGKAKGQRFRKINVSVTTFIPKPHVPFQWANQISLVQAKENIQRLKRDLKMPGIDFKWQIPEISQLEGLFARGDRRLSRLIVAAYQKGCRFDSWTDQFQYSKWMEAIDENEIDIDFFTTRQRDVNEILPWNHIHSGVTKEYLINEWKNAFQRKITEDCRKGVCNDCGVCDFQNIEPRVFNDSRKQASIVLGGVPTNNSYHLMYRIRYSKKDQAKYFGHLEMVSLIFRAIRRAGIPVLYSEGFHPKPRVSFDDPIPLGIESYSEVFTIRLTEHLKPSDIITKLNQQLPDGIRILDCTVSASKIHSEKKSETHYEVTLPNNRIDQIKMDMLNPSDQIMMEYMDKKGALKKINLTDIVKNIDILDANRMNIVIRNDSEKTIRPFDILTHMFMLSEQEARQAKIIKVINADLTKGQDDPLKCIKNSL
ncbi:MAG: TIGR03960 family B12-binding radical SAM protein [Desulfobacteraceae bacterium]|nr:MAG: TIGR03960 family B12-binding radical SAM protein [Desulfobacteraceae bacterium]